MRKVSICASGLLASAIPFVFVGAVIVLGACIFEAMGQQPADFSAPFHAEAAPSEQVLTVASVDTVIPENYIRTDSRGSAESAHDPTRCAWS